MDVAKLDQLQQFSEQRKADLEKGDSDVVESDVEPEDHIVEPDNDPPQKMEEPTMEVAEQNRDASHINAVLKMDAKEDFSNNVTVVFVLGGPGSGKGTQCPLIVKQFGFYHLCAGDLLEAEIESGSENSKMIQEYKKEGKIVPSEVTVKLLQQAMQGSRNKKFLIDGFPRNEENRAAFENIMKVEPDFVLFFDCSQEELTRRILSRNQGRVDDNIETIPKRLRVYFESTLPVIDYYNSKGKALKINAERSIEEVFEEVKSVLVQRRI